MRAMLRILGAVLIVVAANLTMLAGDTSPHKSGFVKANGVRLHYLEWSGGKRGVLLMLAGLGSDAHVFDTFAGRFTDRYRVVARGGVVAAPPELEPAFSCTSPLTSRRDSEEDRVTRKTLA
jgi:hypothetical protein